jgi:hypothetical protein
VVTSPNLPLVHKHYEAKCHIGGEPHEAIGPPVEIAADRQAVHRNVISPQLFKESLRGHGLVQPSGDPISCGILDFNWVDLLRLHRRVWLCRPYLDVVRALSGSFGGSLAEGGL